MGKFGWDLPPGCTTADLPGNRPGELEAEAMWNALHEKFPWLDKLENDRMPAFLGTVSKEPVAMTPSELYEKLVELVDHVYAEGRKRGAEDHAADVEEAPDPDWERERD